MSCATCRRLIRAHARGKNLLDEIALLLQLTSRIVTVGAKRGVDKKIPVWSQQHESRYSPRWRMPCALDQ